VVTLCAAGADGKPSCGDWNFESNTVEGWKYTVNADGHASNSAPTVASKASATGGSRSLAIQFDSALGYQVWVTGPLCSGGQSADLSGRTFGIQVMMETAPDSPESLAESGGAIFPLYYSGQEATGSFAVLDNFQFMSEGTWTTYTKPVNGFFGGITTGATAIGLTISASDWKGTIYIDRIQIRP
jgi:hypothetical protein